MSPYCHIDPEKLLLVLDGDIGAFRKLSSMYLTITPAMLAKLEAAIAHGETRAIALAAHALHGATVLIGADQLSAVLTDFERQAGAADWRPGASDLAHLHRLYAAVAGEVSDSLVHFNSRQAQAG